MTLLTWLVAVLCGVVLLGALAFTVACVVIAKQTDTDAQRVSRVSLEPWDDEEWGA